jgi:uncharacterized protein DUF903
MSIEKDSSKADSRFAPGDHYPKLAKLLPWLLSAGLLTGCAQHYDITLTNGSRVTYVTKPILDKETGVFTYKDVAGHEHKVNAGRVVEIGPHSDKQTVPGGMQ